VLPWLMLGATLLFVLASPGARTPFERGHDATTAAILGASIFELVVAVYGRLLRRRRRLVNLAMRRPSHDRHPRHERVEEHSRHGHQRIAVLVIIVKDAIYWPQGIVMIVGALVGGYLGAHYAQKLPQAWG